MLASVGATKRQKRGSVYFEGFLLGIIAIPAGLLAGLGGIGVTFALMNTALRDALGLIVDVRVVASPLSILLSVLLSVLVIFFLCLAASLARLSHDADRCDSADKKR